MTITDLAPPRPAPPTDPKPPTDRPGTTVLYAAALLAGFTAAGGVVGLHYRFAGAEWAFVGCGVAAVVMLLKLADEWRAGRG